MKPPDLTWDTESGSASSPESEITGRGVCVGGRGAEGVLNFVVGLLGTAERGLIDADLAAESSESRGLRRSHFCLQGGGAVGGGAHALVSSEKVYSHRSLRRRSHLGTPPCGNRTGALTAWLGGAVMLLPKHHRHGGDITVTLRFHPRSTMGKTTGQTEAATVSDPFCSAKVVCLCCCCSCCHWGGRGWWW